MLALGQRVRVLGFAIGERTGTQVAGRVGTIIDRAGESGLMFVRFPVGATDEFCDWVDERHLVAV